MIGYIQSLFKRTTASTLARNSGWMFLGYGLRIVVQAGYFVFIARVLGPKEYGAFVGATALISIVMPFASLGAGNLLVKNVSRDHSLFSDYWGNALFITLVSGMLLVLGIVLLAHWILPSSIPLLLILFICISDLIATRIIDIAGQCFQAVERLSYTAQLNLLPYVLRLLGAAMLFVFWHHTSALNWGWFYLVSTVVSCIVAVGVTNQRLGSPTLRLSRMGREFKEGLYFCFGLSAQTIYNDIDKTMLARLSTLDATGIYAAAYRLIDVAFAPVRSVLNAANSNFFKKGRGGISVSYAYAKQLMPRMIVYSAVAFLGLFLAAPILPVLIGNDFARTVEAVRWLALLPVLKTTHYFLSDAVTGAGYQGYRSAVQIGVAAVNIGLNLWLIPLYAWRGAAWASLASDGALVLAMYGVLMCVIAKEGRRERVLSMIGN